jgi:hypothetical protein
MKNARGVIIVVVVAIAAIGYFALRGSKFPPGSSEGTIGAAKRYQSEQIAANDVQLNDAQTQAFIQSDLFHRMQTDAEFRKSVIDGGTWAGRPTRRR